MNLGLVRVLHPPRLGFAVLNVAPWLSHLVCTTVSGDRKDLSGLVLIAGKVVDGSVEDLENFAQVIVNLGFVRVLHPPGTAFETAPVAIKSMLGSSACVAIVYFIVACLCLGVCNHQDRKPYPVSQVRTIPIMSGGIHVYPRIICVQALGSSMAVLVQPQPHFSLRLP